MCLWSLLKFPCKYKLLPLYPHSDDNANKNGGDAVPRIWFWFDIDWIRSWLSHHSGVQDLRLKANYVAFLLPTNTHECALTVPFHLIYSKAKEWALTRNHFTSESWLHRTQNQKKNSSCEVKPMEWVTQDVDQRAERRSKRKMKEQGIDSDWDVIYQTSPFFRDCLDLLRVLEPILGRPSSYLSAMQSMVAWCHCTVPHLKRKVKLPLRPENVGFPSVTLPCVMDL